MTIDAFFNKRLNTLLQTRLPMARVGVVHRAGKNGLIHAQTRVVRPRVSISDVLSAFALLITFKAVLFAQMGPAHYFAMVEKLGEGGFLDRAGAIMVQVEPVTAALGGVLLLYIL